jgi:hypothetical protein
MNFAIPEGATTGFWVAVGVLVAMVIVGLVLSFV